MTTKFFAAPCAWAAQGHEADGHQLAQLDPGPARPPRLRSRHQPWCQPRWPHGAERSRNGCSLSELCFSTLRLCFFCGSLAEHRPIQRGTKKPATPRILCKHTSLNPVLAVSSSTSPAPAVTINSSGIGAECVGNCSLNDVIACERMAGFGAKKFSKPFSGLASVEGC